VAQRRVGWTEKEARDRLPSVPLDRIEGTPLLRGREQRYTPGGAATPAGCGTALDPDYRSSIGTNVWSRFPTYWARGRMSRLSAHCSRR